MATILKFEPSSRDPSREKTERPASDAPARGEVVIFPGVRLERHAFTRSDQMPDPDPGKPGVKRRRTGGN